MPRFTATMKSIADNLGPVDTLLYNAGNGVWKRFDEITVEQLDMAMKTRPRVTHLYAVVHARYGPDGRRQHHNYGRDGASGMPLPGIWAAKSGQKSSRSPWRFSSERQHPRRDAIIDAQVGDGEGKTHPDSIARDLPRRADVRLLVLPAPSSTPDASLLLFPLRSPRSVNEVPLEGRPETRRGDVSQIKGGRGAEAPDPERHGRAPRRRRWIRAGARRGVNAASAHAPICGESGRVERRTPPYYQPAHRARAHFP